MVRECVVVVDTVLVVLELSDLELDVVVTLLDECGVEVKWEWLVIDWVV